MNDFKVEAKIASWASDFARRLTVAILAVIFFLGLAAFLAWDNHDEEAELMTDQQIANLAREQALKSQDPLRGKPYMELCRDVGQNKEICR